MQIHSITKQTLGEALIQLTSKKCFTKITISDITATSGYNRQTFYYHFRDKYELLVWVYHHDTDCIFDEHLNFDNWHLYMQQLLVLMQEHKTFYQNTVRSNEQYFGDFVFTLTEQFFYRAILRLDRTHSLQEADQHFYAQFFSFGIRGVLIDWIKHDMKDDPKHVAMNLKNLAQDSIQLGYERFLRNSKGEDNVYETSH